MTNRKTKYEQRVKAIFRRHPLYDSKHYIRVRADQADPDHFYITWLTNESRIEEQVIHCDIEIDEQTFVRGGVMSFVKTVILNDIHIVEDERGKGHGIRLYNMVEEVGKLFGCTRYEMTPSGWTHTGETREAWLLRRGFQKDGQVVFKPIGQTNAEDVKPGSKQPEKR